MDARACPVLTAGHPCRYEGGVFSPAEIRDQRTDRPAAQTEPGERMPAAVVRLVSDARWAFILGLA